MRKILINPATVGLVLIIAIIILFIAMYPSDNGSNEIHKREWHVDSVRAPLLQISAQNETSVTIPLKSKLKVEFTATIEEFKYYFLTNNFTNETTERIVIIGEKVADDDSKDIKWTIYH